MTLIKEKIKKEDDFKRVRQTGKHWTGEFARLSILTTESQGVRIGIVVSKKVNNKAVVRNKIRRRLDAILKRILVNTQEFSADIVVWVLPGKDSATFEELSNDIETSFGKLMKKLK